MVNKIISKTKKRVKSTLQLSSIVEDRKAGDIYKLFEGGRGEERIKEALKEINYKDDNNKIILDITELDEAQLEYLKDYIDDNKSRLDRSIIKKGITLVD